ncbi:MAG: STAS domain-containing protein [Candidatus Riflebacteria bacterium]|nr:STAS domain-containing protein [Candidatus Riflebacteria bacterium]
MDNFKISFSDCFGFPVISFEGYCSNDGGKALSNKVREILKQSKNRIVLDFSRCTIISSPGMAALLDTAMEIVEDFQGKCCIAGLDQPKKQFLQMAGIIPILDTAETIEEACKQVKV